MKTFLEFANAKRLNNCIFHSHVSTESLKAIIYSLTLLTLDVCGIKFSLADCDAILRHSYKSLLVFHLSVLDTEEREAFETEIIDNYIDCSIRIF